MAAPAPTHSSLGLMFSLEGPRMQWVGRWRSVQNEGTVGKVLFGIT